MEGTLLVFNSSARVLFDGDATHSFILKCFASTLGLETQNMEFSFLVGSPLSGSKVVNKVCKYCEIEMSNHRIPFDLKILDILEYAIILGVD